MASDVPGMDRSDQSPIEGEILKLPHNEGLFDAIQARGGIIQLHSPQPGTQPSINRPSSRTACPFRREWFCLLQRNHGP